MLTYPYFSGDRFWVPFTSYVLDAVYDEEPRETTLVKLCEEAPNRQWWELVPSTPRPFRQHPPLTHHTCA